MRLILSRAPGENRSAWLLPEFFDCSRLTCHSRGRDRWQIPPEKPGQVLLKTVGRGQDFVLDLRDSIEAAPSFLA